MDLAEFVSTARGIALEALTGDVRLKGETVIASGFGVAETDFRHYLRDILRVLREIEALEPGDGEALGKRIGVVLRILEGLISSALDGRHECTRSWLYRAGALLKSNAASLVTAKKREAVIRAAGRESPPPLDPSFYDSVMKEAGALSRNGEIAEAELRKRSGEGAGLVETALRIESYLRTTRRGRPRFDTVFRQFVQRQHNLLEAEEEACESGLYFCPAVGLNELRASLFGAGSMIEALLDCFSVAANCLSGDDPKWVLYIEHLTAIAVVLPCFGVSEKDRRDLRLCICKLWPEVAPFLQRVPV